MKKTIFLLVIMSIIFSCTTDKDDTISQANISFSFSHNWDGTPVSNSNFNTIQYTNANGEELSISKLRYLISKITFTTDIGEKLVLNGYNLVDVTNNENLTFTPLNTIPIGTYSNVSFTFGFYNDENYSNHTDLNSATWNVPEMLGGGYHYMQLEGKFIDNNATETGYAYHAIRAADTTKNPLKFQDTFITVTLGAVTITKNATFNVEMNIAEWFKNPNTWDLNTLNNMLMPNYEAQIMMYENGQNVFSLKSINQ